jgi:hypothetical protein
VPADDGSDARCLRVQVQLMHIMQHVDIFPGQRDHLDGGKLLTWPDAVDISADRSNWSQLP